MQSNEIQITTGENLIQRANLESDNNTIDYETSKNLTYADIISIHKGLSLACEFYDVNAAITVTAEGICAVALGKTITETINSVIDSNPIDFMFSTIILTKEADSDTVKMLKDTHIIVAPKYTKNAKEYLDSHEACYVTINTPLKDYKQYLSNEITETPLGKLEQTPNLSELKKDSFKVETKNKPTVEQVEDAVFAWKIAKYAKSRAIVIAKDLKTTAIAQGMLPSSIEYALDYACEKSKDAILALDNGISLHDLNVAAQGRIGLIILPFASQEIINTAEKLNIIIITTGFTNILY